MSTPFYSPDGKWEWTGSEWIPVPSGEGLSIHEIHQFQKKVRAERAKHGIPILDDLNDPTARNFLSNDSINLDDEKLEEISSYFLSRNNCVNDDIATHAPTEREIERATNTLHNSSIELDEINDEDVATNGPTEIEIERATNALHISSIEINDDIIKSSLGSEQERLKNISNDSRIGCVIDHHHSISVAILQLCDNISIGDIIRIKGLVTDFTTRVSSLQVNREAVETAPPNTTVGLEIPGDQRVSIDDNVFRVGRDTRNDPTYL